jgi:phosphatidylglycerophosphate synthase
MRTYERLKEVRWLGCRALPDSAQRGETGKKRRQASVARPQRETEPEYSDLGGGGTLELGERDLGRLGFKDAKRVQESVLAVPERKVLVWLAERVPARLDADHFTALGFAAMLAAGGCYVLARRYPAALIAATFFLVLNWLGDSLDGTLARVRQQLRPRYGFYVDHLLDSLGALALMGGLALSGYVQERIALGMLIAFLLLSIEVYLATYTIGDFQLSYWKFGPTEIRVLLGIGNVALLTHPTVHVLGAEFGLFDFGGVIAIAGMAAITAVSAVRHVRYLYRLERLP